jgi:hypothetical protein
LVADFIRAGDREGIAKIKSCKEFYAYVLAKGMHGYGEEALKDGWGRPYRWQVRASDHTIVVRVISGGPDDSDKDGEGAGFFVEVTGRGRDAEAKIKKTDGSMGVIPRTP